MAPRRFRFERFQLDVSDRRLRRDGAPVELNGRYFDALVLLVGEHGRLVTKERFLDEVWRGVPVTDEALTQCIRTLRRQLGDDASRPRFIATTPKHGYRFIAAVEADEEDVPSPAPVVSAPSEAPGAAAPAGAASPWRRFWLTGAAGTGGGGVSGALIGLFYGFGAAPAPLQAGIGAASVLLVLVSLSVVLGVIAGAGVGFGIAAAGFAPQRRWLWSIVGGAGGGMLIGAVGKLIGLDAFNLLFGQTPGAITGGVEGAAIGGALGLGAWLASCFPGRPRLTPSFAAGGLAGAAAGLLVPLFGGRLMGGSLDLLARQFQDSRLSLDQIGAVFGETGFGPISQVVTGGIEGLLFGGCVVAAMAMARKMTAGDGA